MYFLTLVLLLLAPGCQSEPSSSHTDMNIPNESIQDNTDETNVDLNDRKDHENSLDKVEELQPIITIFDVLTGEQTTIEAPLANQIYIADDFIGPKSDLIIIDSEGKELMTIEQVTYYNKSDGVIPKIDLVWSDEYTLHIPTDIMEECGTKVINMKEKEPVITEFIHSDWSFDSKKYPSPSSEHVVRVISERIYLVDSDNEQEKLLGKGYFLGWLDTHRVAWYESYHEEYPESLDIF